MPCACQPSDDPRDRAVLAVRVRRRREHEAWPAVADERLQLLAQRARDVIVGGERVSEVGDAQRMIGGAGTLGGERVAKRIERVMLAGIAV
jgi:hypothetical protein